MAINVSGENRQAKPGGALLQRRDEASGTASNLMAINVIGSAAGYRDR
jgi:hypothetical protein